MSCPQALRDVVLLLTKSFFLLASHVFQVETHANIPNFSVVDSVLNVNFCWTGLPLRAAYGTCGIRSVRR